MKKILSKRISVTIYLPLLLLLFFSGNPIITNQPFSKPVLVVYTILFVFFVLIKFRLDIHKKFIQQLSLIVILIIILSTFRFYILGFVSIVGILALILKIILGFFTVIYYYSKKIDILTIYIKILAYLTLLSFPFFILNHFTYWGIEGNFGKSLIFYSCYPRSPWDFFLMRNSGMFWEPGAFAGYLLLALIFIVLKNQKFSLGIYRKEGFLVLLGLLSTLSTTGYIVLSVFIFLYILQNYRVRLIIIIPVFIIGVFTAYVSIEFLPFQVRHIPF